MSKFSPPASWSVRKWVDARRKKRMDEWREIKRAAAAKPEATAAPVVPEDPRDRLLNQERINEARIRVSITLMNAALDRKDYEQPGYRFPAQYLWFPKDDYGAYELRSGNPPANSDRPKHLQFKRLEIDLNAIPMSKWKYIIDLHKIRKTKKLAPHQEMLVKPVSGLSDAILKKTR